MNAVVVNQVSSSLWPRLGPAGELRSFWISQHSDVCAAVTAKPQVFHYMLLQTIVGQLCPNSALLISWFFFFFSFFSWSSSARWGCRLQGISGSTVRMPWPWKSLFSSQDLLCAPAWITWINPHQGHTLLERILPQCQTSSAPEGSYYLCSSQKARI